MSDAVRKFAVAKRSMFVSEGFAIEKNDVGIIERESDMKSSIFFVRVWKLLEMKSSDLEVIEVAKTGDGFSRKICNICHKLLNTTEFDRNQNGVNNRPVRRPSCKKCRRRIEGKNLSASSKKEWLKQRPKPRHEAFECPICRKRTIPGVTSKIVIDHDHLTGEARDWICDSCNTGIGRFKDDVSVLKRAISFLETKN